MTALIVRGDARHIPLLDESVQMVVTSPPYWGLRDYGLSPLVWGGDLDCEHDWEDKTKRGGGAYSPGTKRRWQHGLHPQIEAGATCGCGAWLGSLGLELTPDLYVEHIVEVFREVWRVLRKDGVVFLNLGDSHFGSGVNDGSVNPGLSRAAERSDVRGRRPSGRGRVYDTSGKVRAGWIDRDCPSFRLCDGCAEALFSRNPGSDGLPVDGPLVSPNESSPGHIEFERGRPASSSLLNQGSLLVDAIPGSEQTVSHVPSPPHASQESTLPGSWRQPPGDSPLSDGSSSSPGAPETLLHDVQGSAHKFADTSNLHGYSLDTAEPSAERWLRTQDIGGNCSRCGPLGDFSRASLKPKDLVMMPARVALALQADGWWLRSDIVWSKPNPMPESVRDRPTRSHEYVFLLSKSACYFYNFEAASEPVSPNTHARLSQNVAAQVGSWRAHGGAKTNGPMRAVGRAPGVNPKAVAVGPGIKQNESFAAATSLPVERRNKRSVWTIATQGFAGAHFATLPPRLVEPCILAGSRPGDLVLDPFAGAGTVGLVALKFGRRFIGVELSAQYAQMARKRIEGVTEPLPGLAP